MTERDVPGGGDVLEDGWTGWPLEESQEPRNKDQHHENAVPAVLTYIEPQQEVPSALGQSTCGLPAISSFFFDGFEEQEQSGGFCRIISSEVIDEGVSNNSVPISRTTGPEHPDSSYRAVPNVPIPVDISSGGVEGPSQFQLLEADIDKLKRQIFCYDEEMRLIKEKADQLRLQLGAKMKELEMKRDKSKQPNGSIVRHLYDPCFNDQPAFQMDQRNTKKRRQQCNLILQVLPGHITDVTDAIDEAIEMENVASDDHFVPQQSASGQGQDSINFGNMEVIEEGISGEPNSVAGTSTILQETVKRGRGRPVTRHTRKASAERRWHREDYAKKQKAKELKEMENA